MKYRRRPTEVEAVQFTDPDNPPEGVRVCPIEIIESRCGKHYYVHCYNHMATFWQPYDETQDLMHFAYWTVKAKPGVAVDATDDRVIRYALMSGWKTAPEPGYRLLTANGEMNVRIGDWVLPEPSGEGFYPVLKEDFDKLYEPVQ